jgi:hypothetical protein
MKTTRILFLSAVAASVVYLSACKDESKWVYDTSRLPPGAYARMLAVPPATDTIPSFDTTSFPFEAEVSGVTSADQVASLVIQVRYLKGSDGSTIKDFVSLGSITSWAIVPNTTELPRGRVSFKGADVRAVLGLQMSDLVRRNIFEFATTLSLKDGRVFNAANFDPNMNNSFYLAAYDYATELR